MATIEDIKEAALIPFQKHRQLSIHEAEVITLEILGLLCDSECKDEETLKYLSRFLTPDMYQDLVDERNLNKRCGYPLCGTSPERIRDPFSMNDTTKKFLLENNPYAYLSHYCSKFHFRCSQFYQVQLSDEALFARTAIHLFEDPEQDKHDVDFKITLFEELLREKASEDDIKSLISGLKRLGLNPDDDNTDKSDAELEDDLSKWLAQIKIVENDNPSVLGDFTREE
ncbi:hypothetical protein SUVZ_05G2300 [Saccharomyces uvarum]|uniref:RNA polymerase II subunit B1 CTD phosphatase RPAP2 homolog n=1 Tax=Saccharomyces uvarum TaxID=230603 RepID=A0ABN8WS62_SACUV|nr:hypothetical protein SUVZ_05G2300 [Saccharomyces uvarum]